MPTDSVVVSAFGALTGSTSSSTSPITASASARPTNTTNAYIEHSSSAAPGVPLHILRLRAAGLVTAGFLPVTGSGGQRSEQADGRRPGAGPGLPTWRAGRARRADPR